MSSAKKAEAARPSYTELAQSIRRSEQLLLEMIRHPESDHTELLPHLQTYRKNYLYLLKARETLRKVFPQPAWGIRNYPWWEK